MSSGHYADTWRPKNKKTREKVIGRKSGKIKRQLKAANKNTEYVPKFNHFYPNQDVAKMDKNLPEPLLPDVAIMSRRLSEDMLERELKAQKISDKRKTQVAPAYSKGAYQYITPGMDLKELGRKL